MIINIAESGFLPDAVIRAGIRALNRKRLRDNADSDLDAMTLRLNLKTEKTPSDNHLL